MYAERSMYVSQNTNDYTIANHLRVIHALLHIESSDDMCQL